MVSIGGVFSGVMNGDIGYLPGQAWEIFKDRFDTNTPRLGGDLLDIATDPRAASLSEHAYWRMVFGAGPRGIAGLGLPAFLQHLRAHPAQIPTLAAGNWRDWRHIPNQFIKPTNWLLGGLNSFAADRRVNIAARKAMRMSRWERELIAMNVDDTRRVAAYANGLRGMPWTDRIDKVYNDSMTDVVRRPRRVFDVAKRRVIASAKSIFGKLNPLKPLRMMTAMAAPPLYALHAATKNVPVANNISRFLVNSLVFEGAADQVEQGDLGGMTASAVLGLSSTALMTAFAAPILGALGLGAAGATLGPIAIAGMLGVSMFTGNSADGIVRNVAQKIPVIGRFFQPSAADKVYAEYAGASAEHKALAKRAHKILAEG